MPIAVEINAGTNTGSKVVAVVLSREFVFLNRVASFWHPHVQDAVQGISCDRENGLLIYTSIKKIYTKMFPNMDGI